MDRTRPNGKVIGIDLIPAQPPKGVATFQGDFLSPAVQKMVKEFIMKSAAIPSQSDSATSSECEDNPPKADQPSYIDMGLHASHISAENDAKGQVVDVRCACLYAELVLFF